MTKNIMADRRQQTASDSSYSARTPSLDALAMANLRLEDSMAAEAAHETNEQTLQRLLSTKSTISTASSFAARQQIAAGHQVVFRSIGTGSIGIVLEHPGTVFVYKFSLLDQKSDKLWNNYIIGLKLQDGFSRNKSLVGEMAVPQCMWFATESSKFWSIYKQEIPSSQKPGDVLCMERIFPLPKIIRDKIIDVFCQLDTSTREQAKDIPSNKDCLVRPYLGRARVAGNQSRLRAFSLRNYKLHLDQIQFLGLHAEEFAILMAKSMAIMHWDIKIDAADVEFVLGSSPTTEGTFSRPSRPKQLQNLTAKTDTFTEVEIPNPDFMQRLVTLWLVDFDACKDIAFNDMGVQQAVSAFVENEPYCPRPSSENGYGDRLWNVFCTEYLATSALILATKPEVAALPQVFLTGVSNALARQASQAMGWMMGAQMGGRGQSSEVNIAQGDGRHGGGRNSGGRRSGSGRGQSTGRGHFRERSEFGSGQSSGGAMFHGGRGWRG
jgi:hypothetical protein